MQLSSYGNDEPNLVFRWPCEGIPYPLALNNSGDNIHFTKEVKDAHLVMWLEMPLNSLKSLISELEIVLVLSYSANQIINYL